MTSEQALRRLGREVRAARQEKFRTVDQARIAAGISRGAWDNVEGGNSAKAFTYAAIEKALGWPGGRCLDILEGREAGQDIEASLRALGLPEESQSRILATLGEELEKQQRERGVG